ncbi:MAG: hypothetical protein RL572_1910, partial [Pseudomonadota bacterium]
KKTSRHPSENGHLLQTIIIWERKNHIPATVCYKTTQASKTSRWCRKMASLSCHAPRHQSDKNFAKAALEDDVPFRGLYRKPFAFMPPHGGSGQQPHPDGRQSLHLPEHTNHRQARVQLQNRPAVRPHDRGLRHRQDIGRRPLRSAACLYGIDLRHRLTKLGPIAPAAHRCGDLRLGGG